MKDRYADFDTVPTACLVSPEAQPDYADLPNSGIGAFANVGEYLSDRQVKAGRGDLPAVIQAETGKTFTYAELARETTRLAKGLVSFGIRPGDRVAYCTANLADAIIIMIGVWKSGAILVPIPYVATEAEIRFFLEDASPRALFVSNGRPELDAFAAAVKNSSVETIFAFGDAPKKTPFRSWIELMESGSGELLETPADAIAVLWHTGGTTGRPKGCYHTHKRYILGGMALAPSTGVKPGDRWAATAPIGHALGIIHNTNYTLLHGATIVLIENFSRPEIVLQAIERYRINVLTGLAVTWARMLELLQKGARYDVSSIRRSFAMWQSASSSEVYDGWKARNIELLNNFGSTSFATWVLTPPLNKASPRAALGWPITGYDVRAVEVRDGTVHPVARGEIGQMAVKGPTGLTYWNRPELQKRDVVDGWTLSDDLIRFDDEGCAHYLGRTDYMISTSGYKVAPVEVEQILSLHPSVREISVVPGPCPIRHEMVVAFIALTDGFPADDGTRAELLALAKSKLPTHKCPQRIEFIDKLPRDAVGKVRTQLVKEWAAQTPKSKAHQNGR